MEIFFHSIWLAYLFSWCWLLVGRSFKFKPNVKITFIFLIILFCQIQEISVYLQITRYFPVSTYWSFIVIAFTFSPLVHFKLSFLYSMRKGQGSFPYRYLVDQSFICITIFKFLLLFYLFFFGCAACGILVTQSGIKPEPPAVEAQS